MALGVEQFTWLPDSRGFLVSSDADLRPDGWTHAKLYTVPMKMGQSSLGDAVPFYTIPKEVSANGSKVWAIGTSTFKWSSDGKWIAFIVHPTASWSADSDILCILSADTKQFIPVAEMLDRDDWFTWAPHSDQLAFIAGNTRFITENKHLQTATAANFQTITPLTPKGYVDNAFTWNDDSSLTVSRAKEGPYHAKLPANQFPSLYTVALQSGGSLQITAPPQGSGDYQPMWQPAHRSLLWIRANGNQASIWCAEADGANARRWISDIDKQEWTLYWSMWKEVVDLR